MIWISGMYGVAGVIHMSWAGWHYARATEEQRRNPWLIALMGMAAVLWAGGVAWPLVLS